MTEELAEKAIYLLDQAVRDVFSRYRLLLQYGPADRYGVIEWAAQVKNFKSAYVGTSSIDLSGVILDVALAAWHPADFPEDLAACAQVTVGARSEKFFTRWRFEPVTLPNLEDQADCEQALGSAVEEIYSSKRTLSAVQSVLSPDDAPSDMQVLPVFESTASHYSSPA